MLQSPFCLHYAENYWDDAINRRKYFEDYAAFHGFDPLIPENWRSHDVNTLRDFKVMMLIM